MTDGSRVRGSSRRHKEQVAESPLPETFRPCPFRTSVRCLENEQEIRAYKLGKKRWSYNQCELKLLHETEKQEADIVDCMQYGQSTLSAEEQESGVNFQVRLANGYRVQLNVFAVYDHPREVKTEDGGVEYEWPCITRASCPREHCEGPVLRTIQRFGKLGKRSGQNAAEANRKDDNGMKNAKFMFISLDEAGSHVKVKHFRMVAGLYTAGPEVELLGTAISPPIRVLANNDVPTGAAYIQFVLRPKPSWTGWQATGSFKARLPEQLRHQMLTSESHSHSSNETEYGQHEGYGSKSLPAVLREHASNWSRDADMGAERLNSVMTELGYDAAAVTSPSQSAALRYLHPDDDASPYQLLQDPNLSYMHSSLQSGSTMNYSVHSTFSDLSPDLVPQLAGCDVTMSPQLPLSMGSPSLGGIQGYLQFPQIQMNVYNPFTQMAGLPEPSGGNWINEALLKGTPADGM